MNEASKQEWEEVIERILKNKSPRPSGITYEHIKHAGNNMKELLRTFVSKCITKQKTPAEWKQSHIYPIPKTVDWEADMSKTRPISIIEPLKKCMTKIITTRLESTLRNHNILSGFNYAATKGRSTN